MIIFMCNATVRELSWLGRGLHSLSSINCLLLEKAQVRRANGVCPGAFCKFRARRSPAEPGAGTPPVPPTGASGKEGGEKA